MDRGKSVWWGFDCCKQGSHDSHSAFDKGRYGRTKQTQKLTPCLKNVFQQRKTERFLVVSCSMRSGCFNSLRYKSKGSLFGNGKPHITTFGNPGLFKITIFHRNPCGKETFRHLRRISPQDSFSLYLRRDVQKQRQIVIF